MRQPAAGSPYPQLSGKMFFDAGETDSQVHVRATICGVPTGSSLPMQLHEFGDLRAVPYSLGAPLVEMGEIVIDNLGSGFFDETGLAGLSLNPSSTSGSCLGRAVALYSHSQAHTLAATCVIGTRDPLDLTTDIAPCTPCTHSLQQQQSIYDVGAWVHLHVRLYILLCLQGSICPDPGLCLSKGGNGCGGGTSDASRAYLGSGLLPCKLAQRVVAQPGDAQVHGLWAAFLPHSLSIEPSSDLALASPAGTVGLSTVAHV